MIISQKQTVTNIVQDKGLFSALGCQCWCSKLVVPSLFIPTAIDLRALAACARFHALVRVNCPLVSISPALKLHTHKSIAPPSCVRATYSPRVCTPTRVLDTNSRASFTLLVSCTILSECGASVNKLHNILATEKVWCTRSCWVLARYNSCRKFVVAHFWHLLCELQVTSDWRV